MKNREYKVLVAIVMALTMVTGSIGSAGSVAFAKETKRVQEAAAEDAGTEKKALKDETVYAKIDGNGAIQSVIVSDQLKNVTDISRIQDVSSLADIKNVKGDEKFTKENGNVMWKGTGKNICYQGTTTKTLPVGVKFSYKLDGQEISSDALEGKSGHLVIHCQYENTTGTDGQSYTPFLMATGMILDDAKFTNVEVKNGKLISDGERNMVLGMGIPKMKEQLGVDDLDIPDYFEVEADVTEYEAVKGITVATNEMFNELETEKLDDLSDLKGAMNELQDASRQLVDGSGELKKGLDTLMESSGTLTGGIDQLVAGGAELKSGASALTDGSKELAAGNKALADGTGQLLNGTKALSQGAGEVNAGLKTAAEKTKNVLLPGVQQLDAGVTQMQNELAAGIQPLSEGVATLDTSLGAIQEGTTALNAAMNSGTEQTGGASLKGLAAQVANDAAALARSAGASGDMSAAKVAQGNGETGEAIVALNALADANPDLRETIQQAIEKINSDQNFRNQTSLLPWIHRQEQRQNLVHLQAGWHRKQGQ